MAARPLHEAVQQAEEAISDGNYRYAVETCRRVLGQFPEFATAHRLLGEALLEEGDAAGAERAFAEVLHRDPQSSAAYIGLSKIAESRGDHDSALAYAQVAWEIMPQRADLRERVADLSEQLYGKGGRLHLTRAALTSLHFRSGRWSRAAAEAAAVLGEQPDRVDVQLRMAESLWRRGSLTAAGNACRAVLASSPSAVMALLMLADVERRQNNQNGAAQLLDQARKIDPDGVRAADLVTIGSSDFADFILPTNQAVFDESADVTAEIERPRIAPAPDFISPEAPVEAARSVESPVTEAESAPPLAASTADDSGFDVRLPDDAEIDAARPPAQAQTGYTSMLRSLEGEGLRPFRLEGEDEDEVLDAFEPADDESPDDSLFSLVSDEELEAARPPADAPRGFTTLLNSLDNTGLEPFQVEGDASDATDQLEAVSPAEATNEFKSVASSESSDAAPQVNDYSSYLTAGWDDIDAEIQRAIPADDAWKGYTGQLRDLDETGLKPFSIEGVDDAEAEPTAQGPADDHDIGSYDGDLSFLDEAGFESASTAQVESNPMDSDLTDGWAVIDDEMQNAIPSGSLSGYTDELKALDLSGVEPFAIEDEETQPETEKDAADVAAPSSINDVVPSDLVADIDLWTFDDDASIAPGESIAAPDMGAVEDLFSETGDESNVSSNETGELDLFDLAELEAATPAPEAMAEVSESIEPFDLSEFETSATAESDAVDLSEFDFLSTTTESVAAESESAEMLDTSEVDTEALVAEPAETEDTVVDLTAWSDVAESASVDADAVSTHPVHAIEIAASDGVRLTIEHLGVDAALFGRVRDAKALMIEAGQIQGNLLLPGVEPPGPTLEDLEQMAAENPDDVAMRRQFAAALVEAEDGGRALAEYHAMFKRQMSFDEDDLGNLSRVAESHEHAARGNRLLGAIYRQAGNFGLSANRYHLSLAAHRDNARKEA